MEQSSPAIILIVDSNVTNIRVVSDILRDHSYKVHIAKSGIQAINLLSKLNPDVIFMGTQMPHMNGFECCKRINRILSPQKVPTIFISGSDDKKHKELAKDLGSLEYLTKPINAELLMKTLNSLDQQLLLS